MTYREAARIVREDAPVKDKSYRKFPIGLEVGHFLRAKRLEGCRPNTIDAYETVLRRFTLHFADYDTLEPFTEKGKGPERILRFIDHHWGESDERTLVQRFKVLGSFFEWAYRTDRIDADPMRKVSRPRVRKKGAARERVSEAHISRLVSAQPNFRDQAAILLMGRLALRREDLRMLQLGDVDLGRDELYLRHAKGGKEHVLPILFKDLRDTLYLHLQERGGAADEFFLYPWTSRTKALTRSGIDQWFRRCVTVAGLTGYTMHQLRHAAIDEVRRLTGDPELARMLARHENIQTTQTYLHSTVEDLREGLRKAGLA